MKGNRDPSIKQRSIAASLVFVLFLIVGVAVLHVSVQQATLHHRHTFSGEDECLPLATQRGSEQSAAVDFAGDHYDVLILKRLSLRGLCLTDVANNAAACELSRAGPRKERDWAVSHQKGLPTIIAGLEPAFDSCSAHGGYHWPQHCSKAALLPHHHASSSTPQQPSLAATPFGHLMAGEAGEASCLRSHPNLCNDRFRAAWPSVASPESVSGEAIWQRAWDKHGSCSGLESAEDYFAAALAAEEALLSLERWTSATAALHEDHLGRRSFSLQALEEAFGGAFGAVFHCETERATGRAVLVSVKQCLKRPGGGFPEPTVCPRWLRDEPTSCHPLRGTRGGAEIWL